MTYREWQATFEESAYFHLGQSGANPQLDAFMRRFGAQGHTYNSYAIERWPITESDERMRAAAKRVLRFKDSDGAWRWGSARAAPPILDSWHGWQ